MPDHERLKHSRGVAKHSNNSLQYYEELFSGENFKRPQDLAKAKVWPSARTYDETLPSTDVLLSHFQQFLDSECSKQDFEDNAACVPGWRVPFLKGKFRVHLFSTKGHEPREKWIEVAHAEVSP